MSNIRNFFRRFVVRSVAAWAFSFVVSPVGVAQQITCPVATSTTNTSTTAGNSLNCQIDSGVTFTNKATAQLTNFTGAVLVNEGTLTNNGAFLTLSARRSPMPEHSMARARRRTTAQSIMSLVGR